MTCKDMWSQSLENVVMYPTVKTFAMVLGNAGDLCDGPGKSKENYKVPG